MKPARAVKSTAKRRPAESAGGMLSVIVGAVVALFDLRLSTGQVAAVVALLGLVPAGVTWLKSRG